MFFPTEDGNGLAWRALLLGSLLSSPIPASKGRFENLDDSLEKKLALPPDRADVS